MAESQTDPEVRLGDLDPEQLDKNFTRPQLEEIAGELKIEGVKSMARKEDVITAILQHQTAADPGPTEHPSPSVVPNTVVVAADQVLSSDQIAALDNQDAPPHDAEEALIAEARAAGMTVEEYRAVLEGRDPKAQTANLIEQPTEPVDGEGQRIETWFTHRPNGQRVKVTRNIDTGKHTVTPAPLEGPTA
jgi:hypothetical protein